MKPVFEDILDIGSFFFMTIFAPETFTLCTKVVKKLFNDFGTKKNLLIKVKIKNSQEKLCINFYHLFKNIGNEIDIGKTSNDVVFHNAYTLRWPDDTVPRLDNVISKSDIIHRRKYQ